MENPTDEAIVAQLRKAKEKRAMEKAIEDLYDGYFQRLWRYGLSRKDQLAADDLEDLIQQVLIDFISQVKNRTIQLEKSLESYLYGMLNYKIINFLRRTARAKKREEVAVWLMQYSADPSPEQAYIDRETETERIAFVNNILDQLSETCRQIFQFIMEDLPYSEIAEKLGYQSKGIKVIVYRCKKHFRELARQ